MTPVTIDQILAGEYVSRFSADQGEPPPPTWNFHDIIAGDDDLVAAGADLSVGANAPELTGSGFDGTPISVTPGDGTPYMLVFLAHWCPHCNAEVPRLLDWKNAGLVPAELNIVGVATAVAAEADNFPPAAWFSTKGWSWPVIVDEYTLAGVAGTAATAFGASGWPYFVIIGEDGLVKVRKSGELEVAELQAIVDEALAS